MRVMSMMWACVLVIAAAAEVADEQTSCPRDPRRHRADAWRGFPYAYQMASEISTDPRPRICLIDHTHALLSNISHHCLTRVKYLSPTLVWRTIFIFLSEFHLYEYAGEQAC